MVVVVASLLRHLRLRLLLLLLGRPPDHLPPQPHPRLDPPRLRVVRLRAALLRHRDRHPHQDRYRLRRHARSQALLRLRPQKTVAMATVYGNVLIITHTL